MATSRLPKSIAGIPALPEEFTQAAKYLEPRFEELKLQEEKLQPMREQKRKEEGNILREETQALIGQKQAGVKASEEKFAEEKGLVEKAEKSIAANPLPEHTPTKENLSTYAQMGSLIMTLGLMLGGPKGNAKAGLDAMTGMMNGWRQGRKDLWAQEAINFEKSFQKVKAEQDAIYKNLVEGRKLAATKAESAKEKYQAAAFIAGANSITAHRISVGDIDGAIKNVESSYKLKNDLQDKVYGMASSLAQNRMQKEFLAQQIAGAKAKSQEKVSSIGKIAEGKLEAKSSLVKQYDSLIKEYETNKDKYKLSSGLRTVLSAVPGGGSVSEKMMSVARANPNKYPNVAALSQFIGKLETVIAPDRHSLYGANLTANELPRYERTIPKLTDDPEIFLKFLENNRKSALDSLNNSKDFYARRGVDLKLDDIYDRSQPFIDTKNVAAKFNTIEEAEAANLPVGTKIIVDGKSATVK